MTSFHIIGNKEMEKEITEGRITISQINIKRGIMQGNSFYVTLLPLLSLRDRLVLMIH